MRRRVLSSTIAGAALCALLAVAVTSAQTQDEQGVITDPALRELAAIERLIEADENARALERAERAVETYPDQALAWFLLARVHHALSDFDAAIDACRDAVKFPGVRASSYYNLACAYALTGRSDEAFAALHEAKRAGFADRNLMSTDPDLVSIRGDKRFVLPVERRYDVLDVGDARGLPYSVDLPPDFDPDKAYPVLFGPGDAEPDTDQQGSLFWGEDAVQRGWIVVESPSLLFGDPVEQSLKLLDHIAATYKLEGDKFHIAGFSANSVGAFAVAMAMPERFHSVTGLPGYPMVENESDLARLDGVVVSLIVGENDELWLNQARVTHDRLRRIGVESYLEVIPDGGHVLEPLFGGELMNRMDTLRKTE